MTAAPVRVLTVTGDPLASAGVAPLLADHPECIVVGEVQPDVDLSAAVAASQPDVILWDLGEDPDTALEQLAEAHDMRVPIVAVVPDEPYGMRALGAGARGLVSPDPDPQLLVAAAHAAAWGLLAFDPSIAGFILSPRHAEADTLVEDLTRREREVLQLMAEGLANKAIADRLEISEHTAKFHVHAILGKLGTQSRTEAVVRAARQGLIVL